MTVRRAIALATALTTSLTCATALSACSAPTPPAEPQAESATPAPRIEAPALQAPDDFAATLPEATYLIDTTGSGKAPLKDGLYEEAVADSSATNSVRLDSQKHFGDLDGDGDLDAVTVLLADSGGSGRFTYVAAVLNDNGAARPLQASLLGDRVSVKSMDIKDGKIEVTWLDRGADEPMAAAPTVETHRTYTVRGDALAPSPLEGDPQAE